MLEHKKRLPETAVKQDTKAERSMEISDEQMEKIAGGAFVETAGWAAGYAISCPRCNNSDPSKFNSWIESDKDRLDGYECLNPACRCIFAVDYWGTVWC